MSSAWFYMRSGQQVGPCSSSQLKALAASGELGPDDYVWKEGMAEWIRGKTLSGLFVGPSSTTPPAASPPPPQQVTQVVAASSRSEKPLGFFAKLKEGGQCATCGGRLSIMEIHESKTTGVRKCANCRLAEPALTQHDAPAKAVVGETLATNATATEMASYKATAAYVTGPWNVKENTTGEIGRDGGNLTFTFGFSKKQTFTIPYKAITSFNISTVDQLPRVTAARLILAGPWALAWKKGQKDKFLNVEFNDDTGTAVSIVFGKGPRCSVETLQSRILAARHDYFKSSGKGPTASKPIPAPEIQADNIPAQIGELAALRDKGILTPEEFQIKKSELLSRM